MILGLVLDMGMGYLKFEDAFWIDANKKFVPVKGFNNDLFSLFYRFGLHRIEIIEVINYIEHIL